MGAWGVGTFEDDTALDWIEEEYSAAGVEAVRCALQDVTDLEPGDYIEMGLGTAARAAAEIVALAFDAGGELGSDVAETVGEHSEQVAEHDDLPALALPLLGMSIAPGHDRCLLGQADIGLAQFDAVLSGQSGQHHNGSAH